MSNTRAKQPQKFYFDFLFAYDEYLYLPKQTI